MYRVTVRRKQNMEIVGSVEFNLGLIQIRKNSYVSNNLTFLRLNVQIDQFPMADLSRKNVMRRQSLQKAETNTKECISFFDLRNSFVPGLALSFETN